MSETEKSQVKEKRKGMYAAIFVIAIIGVGAVTALILIPQVSNMQNPPRIERVDGTPTTDPYSALLFSRDTTHGITVWYSAYEGLGAGKITQSEDTIKQFLKVDNLYCPNGTAKIFWGQRPGASPARFGLIFRSNGSWYITEFTSMDQTIPPSLYGGLAFVLKLS